MSSDSSSDEDQGEQIRIELTLAPECTDRSLEVDAGALAVPANIGRKGLSAVINHLLDRHKDGESPMLFDFIVARSNKLLRTTVEKETRRSGLSLEQAVLITYFPSQEAPEASGESEPLPDWISAMSFQQKFLCTGTYDGSLHVFEPTISVDDTMVMKKIVTVKSHDGPVKCLSTSTVDSQLWLASGSMDHSLKVFSSKHLTPFVSCIGGHASSIGCVDLFGRRLASGDWDGAVCIWDVNNDASENIEEAQPTKKSKIDLKSSSMAPNQDNNIPSALSPKVALQAHGSKVSGLSWGNYEKIHMKNQQSLITASWDHSIKLWDIESQDCILTLNGSRVVSCLDTSYHSRGIVATGHPDCTVRLWDVRVEGKDATALVSDNSFKPSHKAWVSSVQWSKSNAFQLYSTSHDGMIKVWDIRSSLPIHTVRAFDKEVKGLCLALGEMDNSTEFVFSGGSDCIVKHFKLQSSPVLAQ